MPHQKWTAAELQLMHDLYADVPTADIAALLGRGLTSVYQRAHLQRLHKSAQYFTSAESTRITNGTHTAAMVSKRFKPGHATWNKGLHYQPAGGSVASRFQPGRPKHLSPNYCAIGSLRISKDGYLEKKINDTHPVPTRRWEGVHRLVWQAAHGPIPAKHVVCFKQGMHTNVEALLTIDRLQLSSRADLAMRNHPARSNPQLSKIYQLKGQITRQVNRLAREQSKQQKPESTT